MKFQDDPIRKYWLVVSTTTHLEKYEYDWKPSPIFGVNIPKTFELPPPRLNTQDHFPKTPGSDPWK